MSSKSQSQINQISQVISMLQLIEARVSMFIDPLGNGGQNFLRGFRTACAMLGIQPPSEAIYQAVVVSRGWSWSSFAPIKEMDEAGVEAETIVHELITIEIEVWKKHLDSHANASGVTNTG